MNKKNICMLLVLLICSCRNATEGWVHSMLNYQETSSNALSLKIMKMPAEKMDTTALTYKVRLLPSKAWIENNSSRGANNFYYGMDSCFSISVAGQRFTPAIMQSVNNGVANCYEYLVSFNVEPIMKRKNIQLVYQDKFIDGKQYKLDLNK